MRRVAAAGAALLTMAAIAGTTVSAFAGSTSNPGNTFAAAASFCSSPGTVTALANADAWIAQDAPNSNFGGATLLRVRRQGTRVRRTLVRFNLPAIPARCSVTAATLRLSAGTGPIGQVLEARRITAAWTEGDVTWSNQPASTAPVTASSGLGWNQWTVTGQVQAMYSGSNDGFLVRFNTEGNPQAETQFNARDSASQPPELQITFG